MLLRKTDAKSSLIFPQIRWFLPKTRKAPNRTETEPMAANVI